MTGTSGWLYEENDWLDRILQQHRQNLQEADSLVEAGRANRSRRQKVKLSTKEIQVRKNRRMLR